jgi:hypothetical protein
VESDIDVPEQEFADTLGRVLGDAGDEGAEIGFVVEGFQLGGCNSPVYVRFY